MKSYVVWWMFAFQVAVLLDRVNAQGMAVSVARSTDLSCSPACPGDRVSYDEVIVDRGGHWDPATDSITLPADSVYLFHINAGMLPFSPVNLHMHGLQGLNPGLSNNMENSGLDTFGRNLIGTGNIGAEVYVTVELDTALDGDNRRTSFTAFDLQYYLAPSSQHIFSVTRTTDGYGYDIILLNIGGGWDDELERYTIPVAGYYLLTASAGIGPGNRRTLIVHQYTRSELDWDDLAHASDSTDAAEGRMLHMSVLEYFDAGDIVYTTDDASDQMPTSTEQLDSSFSGFLYNPQSATPTVWSMVLERVYETYGEAELLPFVGRHDTVGGYDSSARVYTVGRSGMYYVTLTITCYSGSVFSAEVILNGATTVGTATHTHATQWYQNANIELLLELNVGDTLWVQIGPNQSVWGSSLNIFSSFNGLLLEEY